MEVLNFNQFIQRSKFRKALNEQSNTYTAGELIEWLRSIY